MPPGPAPLDQVISLGKHRISEKYSEVTTLMEVRHPALCKGLVAQKRLWAEQSGVGDDAAWLRRCRLHRCVSH